MKARSSKSICLFILLAQCALAMVVSAAGRAEHVVVLVWDGMRPDFLDPVIQAVVYCFPSGQSTNANVAYGVIGVLFARLSWPTAIRVAIDVILGAIVFGVGLSRVWLGVHWVADAEVDWVQPLSIAEIQNDLAPRVLANVEAAALAVDDGPRSNPGVWCERCNYRSICPTGIEFRFEPVDPDEPGIE